MWTVYLNIISFFNFVQFKLAFTQTPFHLTKNEDQNPSCAKNEKCTLPLGQFSQNKATTVNKLDALREKSLHLALQKSYKRYYAILIYQADVHMINTVQTYRPSLQNLFMYDRTKSIFSVNFSFKRCETNPVLLSQTLL